jgi:hypothetical protein
VNILDEVLGCKGGLNIEVEDVAVEINDVGKAEVRDEERPPLQAKGASPKLPYFARSRKGLNETSSSLRNGPSIVQSWEVFRLKVATLTGLCHTLACPSRFCTGAMPTTSPSPSLGSSSPAFYCQPTSGREVAGRAETHGGEKRKCILEQ